MVLQTLATAATSLDILQGTAQNRSSVIWTAILATSHAKMGLPASFCCSLRAAGTNMMILQVVEVLLGGQTLSHWTPVIWTADLAISHAKMGLGASFCCSLRAADTNMMILQVFLEGQTMSHWAPVIWTEDLATSHAKMGRAASFCRSLRAAGTNMMIFQVVEVFLEGYRQSSAIAAMDLVTLRAIVQRRLEFAEALCQEVEVQSEGHWLTPAKKKLTRPLWSVTFATKSATLPETVSEAAVGLKSAA